MAIKKGALTYLDANNLGDEIQTLAAMQFIKPEVFVNRDNITNEERNIKLIGNAFWNEEDMERFYNVKFNPPKNIEMIPISIHIKDKITLDWFRNNQPIGARDTDTMNYLKKNGIDSYFSGCLTLTLPEYKSRRKKIILLVGQIGEWRNIKFPEGYKIVSINPCNRIERKDINNIEKRLEMARELLDTYRTASLVIASKIHAIMPCIAMGTPIIAVRQKGNLRRLSGYDFIPNFKPQDIDDIKKFKVERPERMIGDMINKLKDL